MRTAALSCAALALASLLSAPAASAQEGRYPVPSEMVRLGVMLETVAPDCLTAVEQLRRYNLPVERGGETDTSVAMLHRAAARCGVRARDPDVILEFVPGAMRLPFQRADVTVYALFAHLLRDDTAQALALFTADPEPDAAWSAQIPVSLWQSLVQLVALSDEPQASRDLLAAHIRRSVLLSPAERDELLATLAPNRP
jgi:hypothetical protein